VTVVIQVLVGLLTTFIGFVIGSITQAFRQRVVYWRARPFWKSFVSGDTKLIVGRFKELDSWEASGLTGVGDMRAIVELKAFLDGLHSKPGHSPEILYADQITGEVYGSNLICVGGPDANPATKRILSEIHHTICQEDPERHIVSMRDTETGEVYSPRMDADDVEGYALKTDVGVVIRTVNPFNAQSSVLLIFGSFGYGTWAGAELVRSKQFLVNRSEARMPAVEFLYETLVLQGVPQLPNIVVTKQLLS
jgi:hypothetical protein